MESELHKLKIDKSQKARRDERSMWPWVLALVGVVVIGLILWWTMTATTAATVETDRVRVSQVGASTDTADELVLLDATGYIVAAHKIELASKVMGRVAWVGVEMGDKIKKGQELVRLEDDEYRARVAQEQGQLDAAKAKLAELKAGARAQEIARAEADVLQAQVELENAEINARRMRELEATRSVSRQQVEDADALMRSRRAQLESARQQMELVKAGPRIEQIAAQEATVRQLEGSLALAMVDLNNTIIRSMLDATVLARNVEVGEFVTTGFVGENGAKGYVVSIADLSDLRVELDISQNDFAKVAVGQPCWIATDAYPDRKYKGVVDLISPEANRQKATVLVRVKVLNPDDMLKPDMNAKVSFLSSERAGATQPSNATQPATPRSTIRVPASAVRDGAVFVVEDGKAIRRAVTTGATTVGGGIEIRKGLTGGEDLILRPTADLKDGDRVKISGSSRD
jgi:HlyD family secretion protein